MIQIQSLWNSLTWEGEENRKWKINKNIYLFQLKRAIYDAKLKAIKWVLFPTIVPASTVIGFNVIKEGFNGVWSYTDRKNRGMGVGLFCSIIPYYIFKRMDNISNTELIPYYSTYNNFEKQIYQSTYKKTLRRRKILYSAIGIPVPLLMSFGYSMSTLDFSHVLDTF